MNNPKIFLFHKTNKTYETFSDVKSVMDFINLSRAGAGWWTVIAYRGKHAVCIEFEDAHSLAHQIGEFISNLSPEIEKVENTNE